MSATTDLHAIAMRPRDERARRARGRRRHLVDQSVRLFCLAATAVGVFFLASILITLIWRGAAAIDLTVFVTEFRPTTYGDPDAEKGGLLHAILGSFVQAGIGVAVGTPIGILVGTYLSEYARQTALGNAVRFVSDVLLSAPSILVGLFIYQIVVLPMGGFSGIAGGLALSIIVIPVVVRTTEDMLTLIPNTLREAVVALGAPKWKMITLVAYRAALSGMVTGILLAFARIAGETAPLLLTSFGNNVVNWDLSKAMASLPVAIYQQANSGFPDLIQIAWAGALMITAGVLLVNIIARTLLRKRI